MSVNISNSAVAEDSVCSEVRPTTGVSDTNKVNKTRFLINLPSLEYQHSNKDISGNTDRDGDLQVRRREPRFNLAIAIFHTSASPLSLAGLQVWSGSLLMCDYLLSSPISVRGHVVLELGSGTGLIAIVAAHLASVVFATDNSAPVLLQCRENILSNLPPSLPGSDRVHVGVLDWKRGLNPDLERDSSLREFIFNPHQLRLLARSDVILACDTVYDVEGVEDFISCVSQLVSETLHSQRILLYLSLEKRVNFSLSSLSAGSEPYDKLFAGLEELRGKLSLSNISVSWERIVLEHTQRIEYERSEYLQLWVVCFEKLPLSRSK